MSKPRTVLDFEEGDFYQPVEFTVTPEFNEQYCFGEEDYHPRYITGVDGKPPLVHPGLLLNMTNYSKPVDYRLPEDCTSLQAGDETRFKGHAYVGDSFRVTYQRTKNFEKRGRNYFEHRMVLTNSRGEELMERITLSTLFSKKWAKEKKARDAKKDAS